MITVRSYKIELLPMHLLLVEVRRFNSEDAAITYLIDMSNSGYYCQVNRV